MPKISIKRLKNQEQAEVGNKLAQAGSPSLHFLHLWCTGNHRMIYMHWEEKKKKWFSNYFRKYKEDTEGKKAELERVRQVVDLFIFLGQIFFLCFNFFYFWQINFYQTWGLINALSCPLTHVVETWLDWSDSDLLLSAYFLCLCCKLSMEAVRFWSWSACNIEAKLWSSFKSWN